MSKEIIEIYRNARDNFVIPTCCKCGIPLTFFCAEIDGKDYCGKHSKEVLDNEL